MNGDNSSEEELQDEINKKKARWIAGKTSLSELTPEERKKLMGLVPTKEEEEAIRKKAKRES